MFSASGTHGPVVEPALALLIDASLIGAATVLLMRSTSKSGMGLLALLVLTVSSLRVAMADLPNIQPVTVSCLLVGAVMGARRGVAFAILVTLLSNAVIAAGWWSIFQAIGWSLVAIAGSQLNLIEKQEVRMPKLLAVSVLAAFLFGIITSLSIIDSSTTLSGFGIYLLNGLVFDAMHALGNVVIALWLAPWFTRFLHSEEFRLSDPIQIITTVEG